MDLEREYWRTKGLDKKNPRKTMTMYDAQHSKSDPDTIMWVEICKEEVWQVVKGALGLKNII